MTWDELKEKAKELGAMEFFNVVTGVESFKWHGLTFIDIGLIKQADGSLLAKNKNPDEMYAIITLLKGEGK